MIRMEIILSKEALFNRFFDLSGKTALVTGGTKGLGKAMALILAEAGARVSICSRNGDEAQRVAAEIAQQTTSKTTGFAADVSQKQAMVGLIQNTEQALGKIDILVANAGMNIRKPTEDLTEEDWDAVIGVNLKGAFLPAQILLPQMCARGWGRIIFLASMLSFVSISGRSAYSASKSALLGLTRTMALEGAGHNVCVNAICPGPFKTPMNEILTSDPLKSAEFVQKIPIGRWGEPEELQALTLYLASPACSFMTGSSLIIDGGWTAQ